MIFIDLACISDLSAEQYEERLGHPDLSREKRWTRFLETNLPAFQTWSGIWQGSTEGGDVTQAQIARSMANFYRVLSTKIHMYNAAADKVVWRQREYTKYQNDAVEHICKSLPVPYRIVEDPKV